jgi:hypothetical protein
MDQAIGHYRRYSKGSVSELFDRADLRIRKLKYINALGAIGWLVNGRFRHQQTPPAGQLRLLNPLVPALKRLERRFPSAFGVSLVAVGQKEARGR